MSHPVDVQTKHSIKLGQNYDQTIKSQIKERGFVETEDSTKHFCLNFIIVIKSVSVNVVKIKTVFDVEKNMRNLNPEFIVNNILLQNLAVHHPNFIKYQPFPHFNLVHYAWSA